MSDPFIGEIQTFGFNFAPRGWATCEGQLLAISSNTALFSLLGTTYGGDGRTTFGLPDLRGRSIVGQGTGPGLPTIRWGEKGGSINATLTNANQLPAHNHVVKIPVNTGGGEESIAQNSYISNHAGAFNENPTASSFLGSATSENTGGSAPIPIRNPFLGMYVCIALVGVFPSRS